MSTVDRGDRGWRARGTLAALVVVAVVAAMVDRSAPVEPAGPVTETAPLAAGRTTCAALELGTDDEVIVASVGYVAGDQPEPDAHATLVLQQGDGDRSLVAPDVAGGAVASIVVGDEGPATLTARWEGTPLLLARRWNVGTQARVPGAVEGPCPGDVHDRWVVPGVVTAGGASATLYLANPTEAPAAVGVSFTTPEGAVAPTRLANLVVPARGRTVVDVNEFAPEEPDLGIVVAARTGRVVVEAVQTLEAAVGGVDGRSLVAAHTEAAEVWTIPWARAADGETAWIWVTNASDVPTDVGVVLDTATGPVVPPGGGVTLPPHTTERIDLRGGLSEVGDAAGVTVRATSGTGIVVSGAVLRAVEGDPVRSGFAVLEAIPAADGPHAVLSPVGSATRATGLVVTNPGEDDAVVTVRVVGRNASTPREVVADLVVAPGTLSVFDLADHLPLEGGAAVLVDVTAGVAAASLVTTSTEGPLSFTVALARPFPASATVTRLPLVQERTLLHPMGGTVADPEGVPEQDDGVAPAGDDGGTGVEDGADVEGSEG